MRVVLFQVVALSAALVGAPVAAPGAPGGPADSDADALDRRLRAMVDRPGGLTAAAVAARAVAQSYVVRQRDEEVAAAEAALQQAVSAFVPWVRASAGVARLSPLTNASLGNIVVALAPSDMAPLAPGAPLFAVPLSFPSLRNQTSLGLSATVPLLDYAWRLPALHAVAHSASTAAALMAAAARLQVGAEAKVTYYNWVRAQMQAVIAEQALRQAQQHAESAARLLEAGAASRGDVMRLQAQAAASELFVVRAHDLQAVLEDRVRTLVHEAPSAPATLAVGEDVRGALPEARLGAPAQLVAQAWAQRLEVQALTASLGAAEAAAAVSRAGALPRLDAAGELTYANPNPRYVPPLAAYRGSWERRPAAQLGAARAAAGAGVRQRRGGAGPRRRGAAWPAVRCAARRGDGGAGGPARGRPRGARGAPRARGRLGVLSRAPRPVWQRPGHRGGDSRCRVRSDPGPPRQRRGAHRPTPRSRAPQLRDRQ